MLVCWSSIERIVLQRGFLFRLGVSPPGSCCKLHCTTHQRGQAENGYKGKQFDTSVGPGNFQTAIGVGQVIAGWDQDKTLRRCRWAKRALWSFQDAWHTAMADTLA